MSALHEFKNYFIQEFQLNDLASTEFKFSHSLKTVMDRKSTKVMNNHVITINTNFYDKEHNELRKGSIKFVNNEIPKKEASKLVNISPDELTNRFNSAKREIVSLIYEELVDKMNSFNDKINDLSSYENVNDNEVIKSEFKGIKIDLVSEEKKSNSFDM